LAIEDLVIPKKGIDEAKEIKDKDATMEQIATLGSLDNTLSWGDQNIPDHIEDVADLELIAYNKRRKTIFK
jgi:hypothetical protein